MVGTRTKGPNNSRAEPPRKRHRGEHRRVGIRGVDLVALIDVVVASHHVRHRPAERCAQGAERSEILVPELAAARRSVRKLPSRAGMGAAPDEIGEALRIVPVPRFSETLVQIRQRKAAMSHEQPVRKKQRARCVCHDPHHELARSADPFMRQVLIQEVGEIRWRNGRA